MSITFPALLLLTYTPAVVAPRPQLNDGCAAETANPMRVLGPESGETGVPLNTSIWFSVRQQDPRALVAKLYDAAQVEVPVRLEVLYQSELRAAVRLVPERDLAPQSRYFIEWRQGESRGGHIFDTGVERDDVAPETPDVVTIRGNDGSACGLGYGISLTLDPPTDDVVLYQGSVDGAVAALDRGPELPIPVGPPFARVNVSAVAIDLAGNRSSSNGSDFYTPGPYVDNSGGCDATGGGTGALIAILALGVVSRMRRRRA